MNVRANINLSMNRDGDKDGLDPTRYLCGEVYDISEELYEDNMEHFTQMGKEAETEESVSNTVSIRRDLVKLNSRAELDRMAEERGLDPNDYDNKTQIAEAIVEAREAED